MTGTKIGEFIFLHDNHPTGTSPVHPVKSVFIPAGVLLAFAAQLIRERKIARLQSAPDEEILGLGIGDRVHR